MRRILTSLLLAGNAAILWGQTLQAPYNNSLKIEAAPSGTFPDDKKTLTFKIQATHNSLKPYAGESVEAAMEAMLFKQDGRTMLAVVAGSQAIAPRRIEMLLALSEDGKRAEKAQAYLVRPSGKPCAMAGHLDLSFLHLLAMGCQLQITAAKEGTVMIESLPEESGPTSAIKAALMFADFQDPDIGALNLAFSLTGIGRPPSLTARASRQDDPLDRLSTEQKIGQMLMVAIGPEDAARFEGDIRSGRLGGGLLKWDKFSGPEAKEFSDRMQEWAGAGPGVPFLIAADHEGGPMFTQRSFGATVFPGNMALGSIGSPELTREAAEASGRELRSLGIHMNFAPVSDVNNNPDNPIIGIRSFGEIPEVVAAHVASAVQGYLSGGVIPVSKHFPGHGDTATDSHVNLPKIAETKTMGDMEKVELMPFRAAIAAGAKAIMPAHMLFPGIDPAKPVTLSREAIEGLLRRKLGFQGVVVSDAMDMGAITDVGAPEASIRAIEAGVDLLLLGKAPFQPVFDAVKAAVESGRISVDRLNASVRRLLRMKEDMRLSQPRAEDLPPARVSTEEHQRLAQRIAENSVTLLRNEQGLIPLRPPSGQKIAVLVARTDRFEKEIDGFVQEISSRHPETVSMILPYRQPDPKEAEKMVAGAVALAKNADILILGTFQWGAAPPKEQKELVSRILALGKPAIVASLMNPYDLSRYPEAKTTLASYGMTPASLKAVVQVIFGELEPKGKLPVTIPGLYPRGSGIDGRPNS